MKRNNPTEYNKKTFIKTLCKAWKLPLNNYRIIFCPTKMELIFFRNKFINTQFVDPVIEGENGMCDLVQVH